MTPDPMHARLRMLLTVCAVCLEDRGQHDLTEWCSLAGEDDPGMEDIPAIWCRAVAVLRHPADVRRAAEWN